MGYVLVPDLKAARPVLLEDLQRIVLIRDIKQLLLILLTISVKNFLEASNIAYISKRIMNTYLLGSITNSISGILNLLKDSIIILIATLLNDLSLGNISAFRLYILFSAIMKLRRVCNHGVSKNRVKSSDRAQVETKVFKKPFRRAGMRLLQRHHEQLLTC